MTVRQLKVGDMENFVYLLADDRSGEAIAVDSGWDIDPIVSAAEEENLEVKFAVATHYHSDHAATLWQLARVFDAKLVAHRSSPISHDLDVDDGDILRVGGKKVKILHTPGHTEDSICVYDGENLLTGDTLLIGSAGSTDFEGGSPRKMYKSLHSVILKLPPKTMIYPGHDYGRAPFRSLAEENKSNPALVARNFREFLGTLAAGSRRH
jgi:hydroxyacylglutathione hydrolase